MYCCLLAHNHEEHNKMETPLSQLIPKSKHPMLFDQSFMQIIQEYIPHANISTIPIPLEILKALKTTSIGTFISCFEYVSLDKSVKQNLEMLALSSQLTEAYRAKKLAALKNVGLEQIGNISMMSNGTSLAFCVKLKEAIRDNIDAILEKESTDSVQNATVYKEYFQNLNISGELLGNFIVAKYSVDERNRLKLKQIIKDTILNTLANANISLTSEKAEKFNGIMVKYFNVGTSFIENELLSRVLDYQSFLVKAFRISKIEILPGFNANGTLKDILLKSMKSKEILDHLFSLPLVVAVRLVGLDPSKIPTYSIGILASARLGVPKLENIANEWLKTQNGIPFPPFSPLFPLIRAAPFWQLPPYKNVSELERLSIPLLSYAQIARTDSSKDVSNIGRESLKKNIGSIFDAIPLAAVKKRILDEDFNTMMFMDVLQRYFGSEVLTGLTMEPVVKYHFQRFSGQFLLADVGGADSLGSLKNKILARKDSRKLYFPVGTRVSLKQRCMDIVTTLKMLKRRPYNVVLTSCPGRVVFSLLNLSSIRLISILELY